MSVRRRPRVDAFVENIEEWVDRSRGKIRAEMTAPPGDGEAVSVHVADGIPPDALDGPLR